ncbi:hypothetical protein M3P19_11230 [Muricauda sp. 2012CJ35-5]|uniref:DUF1330 domain-containing protein n=1 Tax=Flagellimonas spongiicola TaxID=2942208 RepID=A0ABT0PT99_9FLAO|nr:hypothetical protein [Allomuricauda spongiicola]MCL6274585.1 hypothetical protein [Allomuricauda spongiicola]
MKKTNVLFALLVSFYITFGYGQKTMEIHFNSEKVIEIAYANIRGGMEAQLNQDYFPKIIPIAAKYGGKVLGSFEVLAVTGGEVRPQLVAIFEWPNLQAHANLLNDKEAKKIFPIRDTALTDIKLSYFVVEKDVAVTFQSDKVYEFFSGWLTPEAQTALPQYFAKSEAPKLKYGPPKFLVDLKPAPGVKKEDYILIPDVTGIVEWNNTAAFYGLSADPDFKKVSHLLESSVSRLDMIHTKILMP